MSETGPADRYREAVQFLLNRIDYERISAVPYRAREYKLDRMHELLRRLGDPQKQLKIVHIAGTKGKGSTAAMLASMCSAAGYCAGMFTSPHLDRLEERIGIAGRPCSPDELSALIDEVRPVVDELDVAAARAAGNGEPGARGPTYFELTTALALLEFARRNVDLAILEVGMGGRLDSTNVCQPVCSAITSISFDHTKQLGNSLPQIAREKAGIIKAQTPVVSGVVDGAARQVIAAIAAQHRAPLAQLGVDFDYCFTPPRRVPARDAAATFEYSSCAAPARLRDLRLGLIGRHQAANAAVALAIVDRLRQEGWNFPDSALRQGLAEVRCPALRSAHLVCVACKF